MLNNIPVLYKDEYYYSWVSRCILISGYLSYEDYSKELFGINTISIHYFYPKYMDFFSMQIPEKLGIDADYIIKRHTLVPLYLPFLYRDKQIEIKESMLKGNGRGLLFKLGIFSNEIFNSKPYKIRYCPICIENSSRNGEDINLKRVQQVPGNLICKDHNVYLIEEEVNISASNYYFSNLSEIDFSKSITHEIDTDLKKFFFDLHEDIEFILNGGFSEFSYYEVRKRYEEILIEKGYKLNGNTKQLQLVKDFNNYYPDKFLRGLNSTVKNKKENWLRTLTTNSKHRINAIRHLLFIRFIFGGAKNFVDYRFSYKPFGDGPWPCLNKVCSCYNELSITEYQLEKYHDISKPIGVFKCNCGFAYVRVAQKEYKDLSKTVKVREYGDLWKAKLTELIVEERYSIAQIAKMMGCYRNTVIKFAGILGLLDKLNTKLSFEPSKKEKVIDEYGLSLYKAKIIDFISRHPGATIKEVRKECDKEFGLLYLREKEWLDENLPRPTKGYRNMNLIDQRYNWLQKDDEVSSRILKEIQLNTNDGNKKRISLTKLSKLVGYSGITNNANRERLPMTFSILDNYYNEVVN